MKGVMLYVVAGRATFVRKSTFEFDNEVVEATEFQEEFEDLLDEELWCSLKEYKSKGNKVQVFCCDEVDLVIGSSKEDYVEMKEALGKLFCDEYNSENLWKKINEQLDEMDWNDESQNIC